MIYSSVEKPANEFAEMAGNFFSGMNIDGNQFKDTIIEFFEQRKNA